MATGNRVGPAGMPALVEVAEDGEGTPGVAAAEDGEALLDAVGSGDGELVDTGLTSSVAGATQDTRMDKNNARIKAF